MNVYAVVYETRTTMGNVIDWMAIYADSVKEVKEKVKRIKANKAINIRIKRIKNK